ncbi:MAG: hypothetical protein HYX24_06745 [Candidatus Aenigmarchaeota archaeon]|nr:hypothetical protein [Candidatus Aenigmarchaeota archaeon]
MAMKYWLDSDSAENGGFKISGALAGAQVDAFLKGNGVLQSNPAPGALISRAIPKQACNA